MKILHKSIAIIIFIFINLTFASCTKETDPNNGSEHFEAEGMNLYLNGNLYLQVSQGMIKKYISDTIFVNDLATSKIYLVKFLDSKDNEMEPPKDVDHNLSYLISDSSIVKFKYSDLNAWSFLLEKIKAGQTSIEIRLNHLDHPDFKTPPITVIVE